MEPRTRLLYGAIGLALLGLMAYFQWESFKHPLMLIEVGVLGGGISAWLIWSGWRDLRRKDDGE
ncbi:MAG: hypothetical protein AAGE18_17185 [Pseudomonadota bacterium]